MLMLWLSSLLLLSLLHEAREKQQHVTTLISVLGLAEQVNVIAVVPATENMPGGDAFKPGE